MKRLSVALLALLAAGALFCVPVSADSYLLVPGGEAIPVEDEGSEPDYWDGIRQKLRDAEEGDTVSAASRGHERVPAAVLRELSGREVTLRISTGKTGTILLDGMALEPMEKNRIFYPVETLLELYAPTELSPAE